MEFKPLILLLWLCNFTGSVEINNNQQSLLNSSVKLPSIKRTIQLSTGLLLLNNNSINGTLLNDQSAINNYVNRSLQSSDFPWINNKVGEMLFQNQYLPTGKNEQNGVHDIYGYIIDYLYTQNYTKKFSYYNFFNHNLIGDKNTCSNIDFTNGKNINCTKHFNKLNENIQLIFPNNQYTVNQAQLSYKNPYVLGFCGTTNNIYFADGHVSLLPNKFNNTNNNYFLLTEQSKNCAIINQIPSILKSFYTILKDFNQEKTKLEQSGETFNCGVQWDNQLICTINTDFFLRKNKNNMILTSNLTDELLKYLPNIEIIKNEDQTLSFSDGSTLFLQNIINNMSTDQYQQLDLSTHKNSNYSPELIINYLKTQLAGAQFKPSYFPYAQIQTQDGNIVALESIFKNIKGVNGYSVADSQILFATNETFPLNMLVGNKSFTYNSEYLTDNFSLLNNYQVIANGLHDQWNWNSDHNYMTKKDILQFIINSANDKFLGYCAQSGSLYTTHGQVFFLPNIFDKENFHLFSPKTIYTDTDNSLDCFSLNAYDDILDLMKNYINKINVGSFIDKNLIMNINTNGVITSRRSINQFFKNNLFFHKFSNDFLNFQDNFFINLKTLTQYSTNLYIYQNYIANKNIDAFTQDQIIQDITNFLTELNFKNIQVILNTYTATLQDLNGKNFQLFFTSNSSFYLSYQYNNNKIITNFFYDNWDKINFNYIRDNKFKSNLKQINFFQYDSNVYKNMSDELSKWVTKYWNQAPSSKRNMAKYNTFITNLRILDKAINPLGDDIFGGSLPIYAMNISNNDYYFIQNKKDNGNNFINIYPNSYNLMNLQKVSTVVYDNKDIYLDQIDNVFAPNIWWLDNDANEIYPKHYNLLLPNNQLIALEDYVYQNLLYSIAVCNYNIVFKNSIIFYLNKFYNNFRPNNPLPKFNDNNINNCVIASQMDLIIDNTIKNIPKGSIVVNQNIINNNQNFNKTIGDIFNLTINDKDLNKIYYLNDINTTNNDRLFFSDGTIVYLDRLLDLVNNIPNNNLFNNTLINNGINIGLNNLPLNEILPKSSSESISSESLNNMVKLDNSIVKNSLPAATEESAPKIVNLNKSPFFQNNNSNLVVNLMINVLSNLKILNNIDIQILVDFLTTNNTIKENPIVIELAKFLTDSGLTEISLQDIIALFNNNGINSFSIQNLFQLLRSNTNLDDYTLFTTIDNLCTTGITVSTLTGNKQLILKGDTTLNELSLMIKNSILKNSILLNDIATFIENPDANIDNTQTIKQWFNKLSIKNTDTDQWVLFITESQYTQKITITSVIEFLNQCGITENDDFGATLINEITTKNINISLSDIIDIIYWDKTLGTKTLKQLSDKLAQSDYANSQLVKNFIDAVNNPDSVDNDISSLTINNLFQQIKSLNKSNADDFLSMLFEIGLFEDVTLNIDWIMNFLESLQKSHPDDKLLDNIINIFDNFNEFLTDNQEFFQDLANALFNKNSTFSQNDISEQMLRFIINFAPMPGLSKAESIIVKKACNFILDQEITNTSLNILDEFIDDRIENHPFLDTMIYNCYLSEGIDPEAATDLTDDNGKPLPPSTYVEPVSCLFQKALTFSDNTKESLQAMNFLKIQTKDLNPFDKSNLNNSKKKRILLNLNEKILFNLNGQIFDVKKMNLPQKSSLLDIGMLDILPEKGIIKMLNGNLVFFKNRNSTVEPMSQFITRMTMEAKNDLFNAVLSICQSQSFQECKDKLAALPENIMDKVNEEFNQAKNAIPFRYNKRHSMEDHKIFAKLFKKINQRSQVVNWKKFFNNIKAWIKDQKTIFDNKINNLLNLKLANNINDAIVNLFDSNKHSDGFGSFKYSYWLGLVGNVRLLENDELLTNFDQLPIDGRYLQNTETAEMETTTTSLDMFNQINQLTLELLSYFPDLYMYTGLYIYDSETQNYYKNDGTVITPTEFFNTLVNFLNDNEKCMPFDNKLVKNIKDTDHMFKRFMLSMLTIFSVFPLSISIILQIEQMFKRPFLNKGIILLLTKYHEKLLCKKLCKTLYTNSNAIDKKILAHQAIKSYICWSNFGRNITLVPQILLANYALIMLSIQSIKPRDCAILHQSVIDNLCLLFIGLNHLLIMIIRKNNLLLIGHEQLKQEIMHAAQKNDISKTKLLKLFRTDLSLELVILAIIGLEMAILNNPLIN